MKYLLIFAAVLSLAFAQEDYCLGRGDQICVCDEGWTGDICDKPTTCDTPLPGVNDAYNDTNLNGASRMTFADLCIRGTCSNGTNGIVCDCEAGYYGTFCELDNSTTTLTTTRCYYNKTNNDDCNQYGEEEQHANMYCIPDNMECLVQQCQHDESIGWCLPRAAVEQKIRRYLLATNRMEMMVEFDEDLLAVTAAADTPERGNCSYHGNATCDCHRGFEGTQCEGDRDWCNEQIQLWDNTMNVTMKDVCAPYGNCTVTDQSLGAFCECQPGFTGVACSEPVANLTHAAQRCVLDYAVTLPEGVVQDCGNAPPTGPEMNPDNHQNQSCIPDDLQCYTIKCDNPTGWCLPRVIVE
jgi:hypothetical protein